MKVKIFFTQFNLIIAGAFMVLLLSAAANAQVIAFDTAGLTGSEITFNSTTTNMNLNSSQLTRGAGINASTLTDSFNSNNFNVNGTTRNSNNS